MSVDISVVICTYNRSQLLRGCLKSLREQTLNPTSFEVILVDNNSTDDTRQIVESFLSKCKTNYYLETKQGVNNARNRGLKEARGLYVAYLDDDSVAAPEYLDKALQIFSSLRPVPDCIGGPILPFYTSQKPRWFKDKYEIRRLWDSPCYLQHGGSLGGSNMIWQKKTLEKIGGFDARFGVSGTALTLGAETIAFDKIWSMPSITPYLFFSPDLIVYHWVPDFKMTVSYRLKRGLSMGHYISKARKPKTRGERFRRIFTKMLLVLKRAAGAFLRFKSYSSWQSWIEEEWAHTMIHIGELLGLIGIHPKLTQGGN